jgi:hypothetical protein
MSAKKLRNIVNAFTNPIPEEEDWYKKRMEICAVCPKNSANVPESELSLKHKAVINTVCGGDPVCTICGCCTKRLATQKDLACSMEEIGEEPRWGALEVKQSFGLPFDVEVVDGDAYFSKDAGLMLSVYVTDEDSANFEITFKSKGVIRYVTTVNTCSCTTSGFEQVDDSTIKLTMRISCEKLASGSYMTRKSTLRYTDARGVLKDYEFKLTVNRK